MKKLKIYATQQKHIERIKKDAKIRISTSQTASHRSINYYTDDFYNKIGIFSLKVLEIKNKKYLLLVLIGSKDEIITYPISNREFTNIPIEYDRIYDPGIFDEILLNYFTLIYDFNSFIEDVKNKKKADDITAWLNKAS